MSNDEIAGVRAVVKRYPGVLALDNVSMSIAAGEVRALLGKNGAGKSTLIRMLTGAEVPDSGVIHIGGTSLAGGAEERNRSAYRLGVRAVYQELSLVPDLNVAENMFLGHWPSSGGVIRRRRMHALSREILDHLGFPLDTDRLVSTLPPARRQLVEIARATIGAPKLLILDEPTSSLAATEVELVFEAVRRVAAQGVAVLYVSHRMKEIRELAATATVMRDGAIVATVAVERADLHEIVTMMLGTTAKRTATLIPRERGAEMLAVEAIAREPKLEHVSLTLHRGEVLGIAGLLGSGRTELLRIIAGVDRPDAGSVRLEGRAIDALSYRQRTAAGIAITPENRKDDGVFPLLGVDENIVMCDWRQVAAAGVIDARKVDTKTDEIVQRMSVKTVTNRAPLGTLSGGNQQKIVIGRWVYAGASVLLLDEPTRGIDVEAKAQIYALVRALAAEGKAIVFVSSEIEELPVVCDRVVVLRDGCIGPELTAPNIGVEQLLSASIA